MNRVAAYFADDPTTPEQTTSSEPTNYVITKGVLIAGMVVLLAGAVGWSLAKAWARRS